MSAPGLAVSTRLTPGPDFGGRSYTLYQNSYLGYGLMQARRSINALATFSHALSRPAAVHLGPARGNGLNGTSASKPRIPSPCFALGTSKAAQVVVPGLEGDVDVELVGSTGGFAACRRLVEVMMDKDA